MKSSDNHNLKALFPDVAREWHPTKNGDLTPDKVKPAAGLKAWWQCDKGHEWQAFVFNRTRGNNCPYCKHRKASKENNLLTLFPETAKLWHPTKNGDLSPDQVTPHSGKKVWWKCRKGHEWKTTVAGMQSSKTGCPYCSGRIPGEIYNLAVLFPHLAKEWHPVKNGNLTPEQVTPGSDRKVWWRCRKGHEWQAIIGNRTRKKYNCPYCVNHFVAEDNNFQVRYPELAKEWHPTKNGTLTPDKVMPGSLREVWWLCRYGHVWKAALASRTNRGVGCPHCQRVREGKGLRVTKNSNLAAVFPEIAREWHPVKNEDLRPEEWSPYDPLSAWWRCKEGHEWVATIEERTNGSGCPYCTAET